MRAKKRLYLTLMKKPLAMGFALLTSCGPSSGQPPSVPVSTPAPLYRQVAAGEHNPCESIQSCRLPGRVDASTQSAAELAQWVTAELQVTAVTGIVYDPVVVDRCAGEEDCAWAEPGYVEGHENRVGQINLRTRRIILSSDQIEGDKTQIAVKVHEILHGLGALHTNAPTVMYPTVKDFSACIGEPELFQLCDLLELCAWQFPDCLVPPGWSLYIPVGEGEHVLMTKNELLTLLYGSGP